MANTAQAKKRARQNDRRRYMNSHIRNRAMTAVKQARKILEAGNSAEAREAVTKACSQIDRMIPKGIFHKNKAARLKSRLNASLKKLQK